MVFFIWKWFFQLQKWIFQFENVFFQFQKWIFFIWKCFFRSLKWFTGLTILWYCALFWNERFCLFVCFFVSLYVYSSLARPFKIKIWTFILWLKIYRSRKIMQIWYLPTQCDTIMPHFMNLPLLTFLSLISKYKWMDSIRMTFHFLFIEK